MIMSMYLAHKSNITHGILVNHKCSQTVCVDQIVPLNCLYVFKCKKHPLMNRLYLWFSLVLNLLPHLLIQVGPATPHYIHTHNLTSTLEYAHK